VGETHGHESSYAPNPGRGDSYLKNTMLPPLSATQLRIFLLEIPGKTKASDAIQSRQGRRLDAVGDSRRIWSLMFPKSRQGR